MTYLWFLLIYWKREAGSSNFDFWKWLVIYFREEDYEVLSSQEVVGAITTHLFYVHNFCYFGSITTIINTLSSFVINSYRISSPSPAQDRPVWGWVVGLLTMTNSKGGWQVKTKSVSSCLDDNSLLSLPESFKKVPLILKLNRVSKYRPSFKIVFSLILLIAKY